MENVKSLIFIYIDKVETMNGQKMKAAKSKNKAELDEFESFKKEMAPYLDKIEKNLRAVGY